MAEIENLIGKKINRLTVLQDTDRLYYKRGTVVMLKCLCECGNEVIVRKQSVKSGKTKSCGCFSKDNASKMNKSHGKTNTSTYSSWSNMLSRCYNQNLEAYPNYGGRGIEVCDEWRNSFECFLKDMGEKPDKSYSIDRIDNNGNYQPDNCKWATRIEQSSNRRSSSKLNYKGKLLTVTEISRITKIGRSKISNWKNRSGYSDEKILSLIYLMEIV